MVYLLPCLVVRPPASLSALSRTYLFACLPALSHLAACFIDRSPAWYPAWLPHCLPTCLPRLLNTPDTRSLCKPQTVVRPVDRSLVQPRAVVNLVTSPNARSLAQLRAVLRGHTVVPHVMQPCAVCRPPCPAPCLRRYRRPVPQLAPGHRTSRHLVAQPAPGRR